MTWGSWCTAIQSIWNMILLSSTVSITLEKILSMWWDFCRKSRYCCWVKVCLKGRMIIRRRLRGEERRRKVLRRISHMKLSLALKVNKPQTVFKDNNLINPQMKTFILKNRHLTFFPGVFNSWKLTPEIQHLQRIISMRQSQLSAKTYKKCWIFISNHINLLRNNLNLAKINFQSPLKWQSIFAEFSRFLYAKMDQNKQWKLKGKKR